MDKKFGLFCAEDEMHGIFYQRLTSPLQGFEIISRSYTGLRPVLTNIGPSGLDWMAIATACYDCELMELGSNQIRF
jgi:hypothetical protein